MNSTPTTSSSRRPRTDWRPTPLSLTVAAWAAAVMVVGQFALIAAVPVVIAASLALIVTLRRARPARLPVM
ncbi:hypothetical protein J1792_33130 [Streptomyces triculaminicus]|uniref:Uncharacterized protein n=1 Tax=Streptomyces triculaminicus TaxID=2816232 RepID=A0A939FT16_9ACTN|nr:hypothetical protein [Streptomyces triculaminicus]MBO0657383.1 hypothetical protein [Streptomyces triculaminicus]